MRTQPTHSNEIIYLPRLLDEYESRRPTSIEELEDRISDLEAALEKSQSLVKNLSSALAEQKQLSMRDSLTGLLNRRAYAEQLKKQVARVCRNNSPLLMVIADIDEFKEINDRYGHLVGDEVLKQVAQWLQKSFRQYDIVARYGGEEFVIVLENINLDTANKTLNRLREDIARNTFRCVNASVELTLSFGVAEFRQGECPAKVFERADLALYQAKSAGRNQICISED